MTASPLPTPQQPHLSKFVAFAITTQPERATNFYRDTLGFRLVKDDGFALVFDAHGTMLRVSKMKQFTPAQYTVLGWQVEDILNTVHALSAQGITFERYPGLPQDENAICTFPGGDKVAWFKDPDGNVLSVSQHV
ncbi:MAG TPA: VOC family protein [Terriglobales bacterium]|nr:VOC family protein [Terriglobales bacterium]